MKGNVIRMHTDGTRELVPDVDFDDFRSLGRLIASVGEDGLIETVGAYGLAPWNFHHNPHLLLIVDESGALKDLDENPDAEALYGTHVHNSPIFGEALLIAQGMDFSEGYPEPVFIPLPDEVTIEVLDQLVTLAKEATSLDLMTHNTL